MSDARTTASALPAADRSAAGGKAAPGQVLGAAIGGAFGLIYIEVNAGSLPAPWALTLRIAAGVAVAGLALLLAFAARVLSRSATSADSEPRAGFGARYWLVVAAEVAAIWAGAAILSGPVGRPHAVVAWVSVVVGVHFFALAALWRLRLMGYLGAAMALCGVAGLAAAFAAAPGAVVAAAGGLLPGLLLLAAAYRAAVGALTARPVS